MAKVPLNTISNLVGNGLTKINENFTRISEAFDDTLSRDGTEPNALTDDLDVNGKVLYNVPAPLTDLQLARLIDVKNYVASVVIGGEDPLGTVYDQLTAINEEITDLHTTDDGILSDISDIQGDITDLQNLKIVVTPEQFGASGSGRPTDDTVGWTALLAFCSANPGTIIHAKKEYYLPTGLVLPSNTTLDGCGSGVIDSDGVSTDNPGISANHKTKIRLQNITSNLPLTNLRTNAFNIYFYDCTDVLVSGVSTSGGAVGIWGNSCDTMTVENSYIYKPKADGIHFSHGSTGCSAINCTVDTAGDDSFAATYDIGDPISTNRPFGISFIGNRAINSIAGSGYALYSCDFCTISNNIGYNLGGAGISLHSNGDDTVGCSNIVISDNVLAQTATADKLPYSYWEGTDPDDDPPYPSPRSGMNLLGVSISVTGNIIQHIEQGTGSTYNGILLIGGSEFNLADNLISYIAGFGIALSGSVGNVRIASNDIIQTEGDGIYSVSATLTAPLTIVGNTLDTVGNVAGQAVIVSNAGSRRVIISGNVCTNGKAIGGGTGNSNLTAANNTT